MNRFLYRQHRRQDKTKNNKSLLGQKVRIKRQDVERLGLPFLGKIIKLSSSPVQP